MTLRSRLRPATALGSATRTRAVVPKGLVVALVGGLVINAFIQAQRPTAPASAEALPSAPSAATLALFGLGDRHLTARVGGLWLQAFDNQPGISIPFKALDYAQLRVWLARFVELNPASAYPLLSAIRVYGEVPDPARQRIMIQFVREAFARDPKTRWPWMTHAVYIARYRIDDQALALTLADELAAALEGATEIPSWARQMHIFVRAALGDNEGAAVLLAALLASGGVTDAVERRYLQSRLDQLRAD